MTASSYDEALRRVLVHEGGYSNHPSDPGGPTNWGITIHDARAYWKKEATAADVRSMPVDVAKDIYRSKYWDAMCCDNPPAGVDYALFDYGVNSGIARAARVLQRLVGAGVDGEVGPDTIAATARAKPTELINQICDERLAFLQGLRTWSVFGNGWGRRVREVRAAAVWTRTPTTRRRRSSRRCSPTTLPGLQELSTGQSPQQGRRPSTLSDSSGSERSTQCVDFARAGCV